MDSHALAIEIVFFFTPIVNIISKENAEKPESFAKMGRNNNSEAVWRNARELWHRLEEIADKNPLSKEVFEEYKNNPFDENVLASVRRQIQKIIDEDDEFANTALNILSDVKGKPQIIIGGIGGNISGSINVAGSSVNIVLHGDPTTDAPPPPPKKGRKE